MSKFFATFRDEHDISNSALHDYCLRIIHHLFAVSSKPWNCEAEFELFPVMKLFEDKLDCTLGYSPRKFIYEVGNKRLGRMISLSVPTVSFIIKHDVGTTNLETLQGLIQFSNDRADVDGLGGTELPQCTIFHGIVSSSNFAN